MFEKMKSPCKKELYDAYKKLVSCAPKCKEINYFARIVYEHFIFDKIHNQNRRLIVLGNCIPEELIYAAGASPYWVLGGSRALADFADDTVPRDTDPVSRAMFGCLQNDREEFSKDALILIPLVNDSSRKLAYLLGDKGYRVHTVYIPPMQGENSEDEMARQGEKLAEALQRQTGKKITRRTLQQAQEKVATARKQIQLFIKLTGRRVGMLSDVWRMFILYSYYCAEDITQWTIRLAYLNKWLISGGKEKAVSGPASVLLLGSPVYFPNYKLPFLIQDVDLKIAAHMDCTTQILVRPYDKDTKPTVEAVMKSFYQNDCSSAYSNNKMLFRQVSGIIKGKSIDGIVYHVLKGQIEYDFELERLEELFSAHSIPVCRLETDYNYQDIEQLRIRMEAFKEVITQRRHGKERAAV